MSEHSPEPWKWLPEGETDRLVDAEGYDVIYPQEYSMDVDEIDAALIVRAWEIPELEARVKELREVLDDTFTGLWRLLIHTEYKHYADLIPADVIAQAWAAFNQAYAALTEEKGKS